MATSPASTSNVLISEIRRVFRWGIAEELVKAETLVRLKAVDHCLVARRHLRTKSGSQSRSKWYDELPTPFPIVRAMLRVQIKTGMRPSRFAGCAPVTSIEVAKCGCIVPTTTKRNGRGRRGEIPLVGDARAAVEDYINRDSKAYLFSPVESMAWLRANCVLSERVRVIQKAKDRTQKDARAGVHVSQLSPVDPTCSQGSKS